MDREQARRLLMGFLDGELGEEERREIEELLAKDPELRREEAEYRKLKEMTDSLKFVEPTEAEWRAHWTGVYNRLERGVGWVLLSLGGILLLLTGFWHLLKDFLLDPEPSLFLRIGVGAVVAGGVVLGVSVVRERIRVYRVDRYNEVEL